MRADQLLIQPAAVGVTRTDHRDRAATHRVLATIQPEAVLLFLRPVAGETVLPEDRQDLGREIDLLGRLLGVIYRSRDAPLP